MSAGSATLVRAKQLTLLGALGVLALTSWVWMFRMAGPHAGHGQTFVAAAVMWFVMMVAMMLPTVLPWVMLFARLGSEREGRAVDPSLFVAGYLLAWLGYSLLAAALQTALAESTWFDTHRLRLPAGAGGAVLVVAGLFQWSPLKSRCLRHCRSPLGYLLRHRRDGALPATILGLRHGSFCVLCCWALMAVAFAVGVMNLWWMVGLTAALCIEKIAPAGESFGRVFGLALVAWGATTLIA